MHADHGIYFHGTTADRILNIMQSGVLRPDNDRRIFLGRHSWEACFVHGGDKRLRASFVIKVKLLDIGAATRLLCQTPGVQDTLIIQTDAPIQVEVLELYVRRLHRDSPASLERIAGAPDIRAYLQACGAMT
ncbi:hypothetical protein [Burkholderia guangdongensis]|uniref:hypothetical protein n=1 Tax=Burkholderia guangdongensis TaxID=1792500 RepID=UPI0015CCA987|nr:hypothetical protein [Burkholderia guangdongensis]